MHGHTEITPAEKARQMARKRIKGARHMSEDAIIQLLILVLAAIALGHQIGKRK